MGLLVPGALVPSKRLGTKGTDVVTRAWHRACLPHSWYHQISTEQGKLADMSCPQAQARVLALIRHQQSERKSRILGCQSTQTEMESCLRDKWGNGPGTGAEGACHADTSCGLSSRRVVTGPRPFAQMGACHRLSIPSSCRDRRKLSLTLRLNGADLPSTP